MAEFIFLTVAAAMPRCYFDDGEGRKDVLHHNQQFFKLKLRRLQEIQRLYRRPRALPRRLVLPPPVPGRGRRRRRGLHRAVRQVVRGSKKVSFC